MHHVLHVLDAHGDVHILLKTSRSLKLSYVCHCPFKLLHRSFSFGLNYIAALHKSSLQKLLDKISNRNNTTVSAKLTKENSTLGTTSSSSLRQKVTLPLHPFD